MKKSLFAGATLTALFSGHALANEPLTLVLDWYINPTMRRLWWPSRSAPLRRRGWTSRLSLRRPGAAARMVAARQADLAITYQPQVHFFADEGLPLVRVGTLINSPLNTVIALDKQIKTRQICKAKRWATRSAALSRPPWRPWRNMRGSIRPASSWLTSISS
jgi:putative hydroxymethylpyrimidine transport system substrate-binding protein